MTTHTTAKSLRAAAEHLQRALTSLGDARQHELDDAGDCDLDTSVGHEGHILHMATSYYVAGIEAKTREALNAIEAVA